MSRAADVAEQARAHGVKAAVPLLVTPGSEQIRATIERDGQLRSLNDIGAVVLANACGPCIGQWRRDRGSGDAEHDRHFVQPQFSRAATTASATTMNFIASPEIVTAFALAGRLSFNPLTDTLAGADGKPFRLDPPRPAPEVPARRLRAGDGTPTSPPPADGTKCRAARRIPHSERLQCMEPWPAWDGRDFIDMPVLHQDQGQDHHRPHLAGRAVACGIAGISTSSATTCSSARPTRSLARSARQKILLSGETGHAISKVARDYRARGIRWVVIGDWNYGEGSSREHAALSPRLLGGAAVIARSFARIHESNLKKQGLLALTFRDPDDYDRIREDDRLSLIGLAAIAPAKPVECRVEHSDGAVELLQLDHSYSARQIEWFRAGSALNVLRHAADSALEVSEPTSDSTNRMRK